jgi:hypothetical protein
MTYIPFGIPVISTVNSSTTNLAVGNSYTFTGTAERTDHRDIMINLYADQNTTIQIQFSQNGTNWDSTLTKYGTANQNEFCIAVKGKRYIRVIVTTASLTTTVFRLQTQYGEFRQGNSPENQATSLDGDALSVRPTDFQDEVRLGRRTGITGWNKFAYKSNTTAAGGEESIWPVSATNFTILTSASTFTIAYNNATDGAAGGATGATQLAIYYIDSDGLPTVATHTLGSTGSDVTAFSGLGINRIAVSNTGSNDVNVNDITITATTGGSTQAFLPAGEGVTQQAIFFVGSNHTAIAKFLYVNVNKLSGSSPKAEIKGWVYNRAVDSKFLIYRQVVDTSTDTIISITDPIGFVLNSTDVLYFTIDTDTNSTIVNIRFSLNEYQKT